MFKVPSVDEMGGEDSPITPMFAKRQKIVSPVKSSEESNALREKATSSSSTLSSIKNTAEPTIQSSSGAQSSQMSSQGWVETF